MAGGPSSGGRPGGEAVAADSWLNDSRGIVNIGVAGTELDGVDVIEAVE